MNWLNHLICPNILNLKPYKSARNEYSGNHYIQLDANESPEKPYGEKNDGLNRYPEPQPSQLRQALADNYGVDTNQMLITRGMDEGIDLLIRAFCQPTQDTVVIFTPTFGYYQVAAQIQGVETVNVPLLNHQRLDWSVLDNQLAAKIIFVCSPNNPTGTLIDLQDIKALCNRYAQQTIIAVDEAYIEFSNSESAVTLLSECPNLVVMRTLSKAYGLAGLRIGSIITCPEIIAVLRKIIPPYPIPTPCAEIALKSLSPIGRLYSKNVVSNLKQERQRLMTLLTNSPKIKKIYPSEANFLLIIAEDAHAFYQELKQQGIIVRKRTEDIPNALRLSIGTHDDNQLLLAALNLIAWPKEPIRQASVMRKTNETEIVCQVILDNQGNASIQTGIGFFDHMLEQLARHSGISLHIQAIGDTHIDAHHTVEDVAITLGQALKKALNNKSGINRYGFVLPMDEAEAHVSIDLSGRGHCRFKADFQSAHVGQFPTEMVHHFFQSLSAQMQASIHIRVDGENTHHKIEAIFKAFARALRQAVTINGNELPTTKGML